MSQSIRRFSLLITIACSSISIFAQQPNMDALRWRFIGPEGNRFTSVAGVPGQPNIYYAGAASGGI